MPVIHSVAASITSVPQSVEAELLLEDEETPSRGLLQQQLSLLTGRGGSRARPLLVTGILVGVVVLCLVATAWTVDADTPARRQPSSTVQAVEELVAVEGTEEEEDTGSNCAATGDNCQEAKCCRGSGMQCYSKDASWAECQESCTGGPDPTSGDKGPWSCDKLGSRTAGEAPTCSQQGEDCTQTQCCADTGMQCYEKVKDGWAMCRPSCKPGLDLTDADPHPWSCKELGARTPDVASWVWDFCTGEHADCTKSECCNIPGMQCFEENEYYGECMTECSQSGWGCKTRGHRLPQPAAQGSEAQGPIADWVAETCAKLGDNCMESTCCVQEGFQCFQKNETYAGCKNACAPGPDLYDRDSEHWSCEVLGPRTPGAGFEPWEARWELADWVAEECGDQYSESCAESQCCKNIGDQCFAKNKDWATCRPDCTPGPMKGDKTGNWTCNTLGPRTHRPFPSLFCFHVLQAPPSYEPEVVAASMGTGAGIFSCDKYSLYSTTQFSLGEGKDKIDTVTFEPAEVVQSKDATAGNAELFMHVWESVRQQGLYMEADWTIKVDPDAVLLPDRLRFHLDQFAGRTGYVVNCAKPYMPEGPMMFGALEAFSKPAMEAYYEKANDCRMGLAWQEWGEDLYMGKCLEKIGVDRLNDWKIYSDGVCRGVDCGDPDAAAFHPMKDVNSWKACLEQTKNPHESAGDSDEDQPQWFKEYMAQYAR